MVGSALSQILSLLEKGWVVLGREDKHVSRWYQVGMLEKTDFG